MNKFDFWKWFFAGLASLLILGAAGCAYFFLVVSKMVEASGFVTILVSAISAALSHFATKAAISSGGSGDTTTPLSAAQPGSQA